MYTVLISLALVACALAQTQTGSSTRYRLTSNSFAAASKGFATTGGHALVTFNAARDDCDSPNLLNPCGWGMQRSVEYAKNAGSSATTYSAGQRNAFRLNKISVTNGFWSGGNVVNLNDNLNDLSTLEADLRYEYFHNSARKTTTGPNGNHGVFLNSADADENNDYQFSDGSIFNDCFRIFSQGGFPDSYDFIAQGTFNGQAPSNVNYGNTIVYGFWGEAVVGSIADGAAENYYESATYTTAPGGLASVASINNEITSNTARTTTEPGMENGYSTPTTITNSAPIWPLAYQPAGSFASNDDRVVQICYSDGATCTFSPVARLTGSLCGGFSYFA